MKIYLLRLVAGAIDFFLLLPFLLVFSYFFLSLTEDNISVLGALLFSVTCLLLAFALYSPLCMIRKNHNGQTFGKQLVGLKVSGQSPWTYPTALWRQFFIIALLFLLLGWFFLFIPLLLDVLWPLWSDKRKMLHDKLSASRVERA